MEVHAARKGGTIDQYQFRFKGKRITETATPFDLNIEDGGEMIVDAAATATISSAVVAAAKRTSGLDPKERTV